MCPLSSALREYGLESLMHHATEEPFFFVGSLAVRTACGGEWPVNDVDILCSRRSFPNIIALVALALGTITGVDMGQTGDARDFYMDLHDRVVMKGPKCNVDILCARDYVNNPLNLVAKYDLTCCRVAYDNDGDEYVLHDDARFKRLTVSGEQLLLMRLGRYADDRYKEHGKTARDLVTEQRDLARLKDRIAKYQARGFTTYDLPVPEPEEDDEQDVVGKECPVCKDDYSSRSRPCVITECGHVYCERCILKLMERDPQCPACKSSFTHFKRLYFQ